MAKHPRVDLLVGRRLLQSVLPQARALRDTIPDGQWQAVSALGRAINPSLRVDNLDAVLIYEAPLGGWHADIVLKTTPIGVPNVFGTRVETPCATRQEAHERAVQMVMGVIVADEQAQANPQPAPSPVFLFHGTPIDLSPDVLESVARQFPQQSGYGDAATALIRLHAMEQTLFPAGPPTEAISLSTDAIAEFLTVIHLAALSGVFRYPPRKPGQHG